VLILDEAHRIRETSVSRWTPKDLRQAPRPQIDELMAAARVPVFLLDEHQVVRPGELGPARTSSSMRRSSGCRCTASTWTCSSAAAAAPRTCSGSFGCGLAPGGPVPWQPDRAFEVETASTPAQLEDKLRDKLTEGYGAR
jgi:hypothetical protein